jgi:ribonuclease P protein component
MPRRFSLTRADFKHTHHFRRIIGEYFSLSFGHLPGRSSPGAAVVVSSKAAPRAVDRNRIKRRCRSLLYEYLRKNLRSTVILYAKKGAATTSFADLKKDIERLLAKI